MNLFDNFYYFWSTVAVGGAGTIWLIYVLFFRNRFGTLRRNALVVGMYAEYKPFEFVNKNGVVAGYDVDLIREIARRNGLKLVLKNLSFDSLIPALKRGDIDVVISGMSITPERLHSIEMIPYHGRPMRSYVLMFWRSIPEGVTCIEDLEHQGNRKIAVQVGTLMEDFLAKYSYIEAKPICSVASLILEIRHGDAIAAIITPGMAYTMQSEYPKIKLIEIPLPEKDWILGEGIGIRKGNKLLARNVEQSLLDMRDTGYAQRIHLKWFGSESCDL